jgi:hypothetical protein
LALERELDVRAISGVAGRDDPADIVDCDVLAEFAAAVEVGGEDTVTGETGVEGAVRVVADQRDPVKQAREIVEQAAAQLDHLVARQRTKSTFRASGADTVLGVANPDRSRR